MCILYYCIVGRKYCKTVLNKLFYIAYNLCVLEGTNKMSCILYFKCLFYCKSFRKVKLYFSSLEIYNLKKLSNLYIFLEGSSSRSLSTVYVCDILKELYTVQCTVPKPWLDSFIMQRKEVKATRVHSVINAKSQACRINTSGTGKNQACLINTSGTGRNEACLINTSGTGRNQACRINTWVRG